MIINKLPYVNNSKLIIDQEFYIISCSINMLLYPHYLDILDEVIHFISIFWKVRKNIREEREREREK